MSEQHLIEPTRTIREVHLARRIARACRDGMSAEVRSALPDLLEAVGIVSEDHDLVAFDIPAHGRQYRIYIVEIAPA